MEIRRNFYTALWPRAVGRDGLVMSNRLSSAFASSFTITMRVDICLVTMFDLKLALFGQRQCLIHFVILPLFRLIDSERDVSPPTTTTVFGRRSINSLAFLCYSFFFLHNFHPVYSPLRHVHVPMRTVRFSLGFYCDSIA